MSGFIDDFQAPDYVTMDEIKRRVISWQRSYAGKDYVLQVKSERHVILTKTKHDLKVCCYPCIIIVLSAFVIVMFPIYSYAFALAITFGYIAFIMIVMIVAYGYFFLNPKKAEYTLMFSYETPINIRIHARGAIAESAHEYQSLKSSILGGRQEPGPGLVY